MRRIDARSEVCYTRFRMVAVTAGFSARIPIDAGWEGSSLIQTEWRIGNRTPMVLAARGLASPKASLRGGSGWPITTRTLRSAYWGS